MKAAMQRAVGGLLAVALCAGLAVADKSPKPGDTNTGSAKTGQKKPDRREIGLLPALAFDSDLGFGFGALGTLAQFHPGYRPYKWRIQWLLFATTKRGADGDLTLPYHEDYIRLDMPGLLDDRLRLNGQLRFRRFSNTGYYGLGNAAPDEMPWEDFDPETQEEEYLRARRYYQYDRIYPSIELNARLPLWDRSTAARTKRLEAFVGGNIIYNIINLYDQSKLSEDLALSQTPSPDGATLAEMLYGVEDHLVVLGNVGLLWDTRDDEYTPTRGMFAELSARISPGVDAGLRYAGLFASASYFVPLHGEHLVLGVRGLTDVLLGKAPIYEMALFGVLRPLEGPGGGWSLRGARRFRYHGKIKLITNVEVRSQFLPFRVLGQRFHLGALLFADAGRVFTDLQPVTLAGEDLDGGFWEFKAGLGAGLRLKWGDTLVIRAEPAFSPTDGTSGFYLDIGHIF